MRSSRPEAPLEDAPLPIHRRIAIIVVTYNGESHINACLRSLLLMNQDRAEIIVVDNASTDSTVEIVRREFPEVRVLRARRNLGYGLASNRGAFASHSEYVGVVNQDIRFTSGWAQHLMAALDQDPTAALASPKVLLDGDPSRINTCGNVPHYTGITPCRGYNHPAHDFSRREEIAAVSGAAFVIRRKVYEELHGFDPTFFLYLEDTDLSTRARLAGYRCLYVPESIVMHDFRPRFSADKHFFLERNRLIMLLKTYRLRTLLLLTPALLLTELAVFAYSLFQGPDHLWSKVRAYAWIARHPTQIVKARRQAQGLRKVSDKALLELCTVDLQLDELGHPLGRLAMALINPLYRGWHRLMQVAISW